MLCNHCRQELPDDAQFCFKCGQRTAPGGVTVGQKFDKVEGGTATGIVAGEGALTGGLAASVKQDVGTVSAGGTVTGAVLGGSGPTTVGGEHRWGDTVQGPKREVRTHGGAYFEGAVNTDGGEFVGGNKTVHGDEVHGDKVGGDKVGGDKTSMGDVSGQGIAIGRGAQAQFSAGATAQEIERAFAPLMALLLQAPPGQREAAEATAGALKKELAKDSGPNDETLSSLVKGLVSLVPAAASAVGGVFVSPVLAGMVGPATRAVLAALHLA